MKILDVQAKDIHVTFEVSLTEINMLLDFLSRAKVTFDGAEEPEFKKTLLFVQDEFFPILDKLTEEVKNDLGPDSPGVQLS
ncbi:MAG: hypothetical protein DRQ42_00215 [Gammaproteobacteria bacterium]|nr:MAG: hypothetical protein DRQ42_00215 [Gammaproteobacteria bacterium]